MKIQLILSIVLIIFLRDAYCQNPCNNVVRSIFKDSLPVLEDGQHTFLIEYLESIDTADLIHFIIEFDIKNESPAYLNNARSSCIQNIINNHFNPRQVKYKFIPPEEPDYFTGSWASNDQDGRWYTVQNSIVIYADCHSLYPEKLELRQSFIDSMHNQTREHIIIDTLSNHYKWFHHSKLNQQQNDLVFIHNFSDELFKYDFIDLMINHSELILVEAYEIFKRIDCQTTLDKIDEFRQVYQYFEPLFLDGKIPAILDENSPEYDDAKVNKVYKAILEVEEWISFLPREKVLCIYNYIIDNKAELYK